MTTNDKSQPTGWVVVCFKDSELAVYDGRSFFGADDDAQTWRKVNPYQCEDYAEAIRTGTEEVHPWPLPAAVLARLKAKHPTVDWSQVPVAEEPVEPSDGYKATVEAIVRDLGAHRGDSGATIGLGGAYLGVVALIEEVNTLRPYAPQPFDASLPTYSTLAKEHGEQQVEIEELRQIVIGCAAKAGAPLADEISHDSLLMVPSEVGAVIRRLTRERDDARASLESVAKQLRREADEVTRERAAARAELAKARLSRLDRYAKAALTGVCACSGFLDMTNETVADLAVQAAQATIRAIDGAGGA